MVAANMAAMQQQMTAHAMNASQQMQQQHMQSQISTTANSANQNNFKTNTPSGNWQGQVWKAIQH